MKKTIDVMVKNRKEVVYDIEKGQRIKKALGYLVYSGIINDQKDLSDIYSETNISKAANGNEEYTNGFIKKLSAKFLFFNEESLISGNGEILKSSPNIKIFTPEDLPKQVGRLYLSPIYNSLPVSAGKMELSNFEDEKPNGYAYTFMPNVIFFPVIGISFEPIIPAGYYIGVTRMDNISECRRIDPEKIYLIITREDRMMKRLRVDENDSNKLWCISPNYPDFDIWRDDILEVYHVFFYGKMI